MNGKRQVELTDQFIACATVRNKDAENLVKKFMKEFIKDSRRILSQDEITIDGLSLTYTRRKIKKSEILSISVE